MIIDPVDAISDFADFLEIGLYSEMERLANEQGVSKKLREAMEKISRLIQYNLQQVDAFMVQTDFYRDVIRKLTNNESISESEINQKFLINQEKRQEVLPLVKQMSELKSNKSDLQKKFLEEKKARERSERDNEQGRLKLQQMKQELMRSSVFLNEKDDLLKSVSDQANKLRQMERQCKQLQEQIIKGRREWEQKEQELNLRLKKSDEENEELKKRCAQLQEKCEQLQKKSKQSKKNSQLYNKNKQLAKKNEQLNKQKKQLKNQNQNLKKKIGDLNDEFKRLIDESKSMKLSISESQISEQKEWEKEKSIIVGKSEQLVRRTEEEKQLLEKKVEERSKILQQKDEQNKALLSQIVKYKSEIGQLKSKSLIKGDSKSMSRIFIGSNSLLSFIGTNQTYSEQLLVAIKRELGRQIESIQTLYNFSLMKGDNFHKRVDGHKNVMLICLTEEERIVGGFTSAGFSLKGEEGPVTAFIFNFINGKLNVYRLKGGMESTHYDWDFLMFGQQQLCIETGSNTLFSYWVSGEKKLLHYECAGVSEIAQRESRDNFLSVQSGRSSVSLRNYELVQLHML